MLQDSQAWKSMLSNWRLVVAAIPDRPELEASFARLHAGLHVRDPQHAAAARTHVPMNVA